MPRILFICKQRPTSYGTSYGLLNSCRFLVNALIFLGVEAKLVEVIDNNGIDREVYNYKPTHVFIEALWVVPEKFEVLIPLHPTVQWYVRLHSNVPFLSNEGMAIEWLKKYKKLSEKFPQFGIAVNSMKMMHELVEGMGIRPTYSPNIYCPHHEPGALGWKKEEGHIDIGCFGAIRPLKNQLIQAMAAIAFAEECGMKLNFHINYTRIETHGESTYKNLVKLFEGSKHKLITHDWMSHEDFLQLVKAMDYGLQVSFSETFNIVAADFSHMNVPIVGSAEIKWLSSFYQASTTDVDNIVTHLWIAKLGKKINLQRLNKAGLDKYNKNAIEVWEKFLHL